VDDEVKSIVPPLQELQFEQRIFAVIIPDDIPDPESKLAETAALYRGML
jgi:hypothetical protein